MSTRDGFQLQTQIIGALPLVNHCLERLQLQRLLADHLAPPDPRASLSPARILAVLVRNLAVSRLPLYAVGEWVQDRVPEVLGLRPGQPAQLNDDCIGRALDRLFDADRSALLTELVTHMVREFDVGLEQLHNDSTTLSLHGHYDTATGEPVRGKPTVAATWGHSKDHRPDLKQLLWILTVSADGAVPVHFKVSDGNTEDSTTHMETWNLLRRLVGSAQFIYVADSKLCTQHNLAHIHGKGGKFVTVLPRTRKEDGLFRDWLQHHCPDWQEVARKPHPRRKHGPPDIFQALPSPIPEANGFRLIWYQSSHKIERDAQARRNAIHSACKGLSELRDRLEGPRPRFRQRGAVARAVDKILGQSGAGRWISYQIETVDQEIFRQEKRGRPGKTTRWRRTTKTRFKLGWQLRNEQIETDLRCDGIFPLVTNCSEQQLAAAQVLQLYKGKQPLVEKRHDLLKNVEAATPMYLKSISRIEALLLLVFIGLLVHALIERELRQAMRERKLQALPLYPEQRPCKAPSTRRVLEIFGNVQRHLLYQDGHLVQSFAPELTDTQLQILQLLEIEPETFLGS